ncbi:MAG: hypothetical protein ACXVY5_01370 [Gaiellales bacterium]
MDGKRPAASPALAGIYLVATLLLCVGLGLGAGWLTGSPGAGAAVGGAVGIPLSFYSVYRRFRDI